MAKADAFGLYVVQHRDTLEVDEWIASHQTVGDYPQDTVNETLMRMTELAAISISTLDNVISVEPAQPGRFEDDTEGAVIVREDGNYEVVEA